MRFLILLLLLAPGCAVALDVAEIPGTDHHLVVGDSTFWQWHVWAYEDGRRYEVLVATPRRPHGGYQGTIKSIKSIGDDRYLVVGAFGFDSLVAEAVYDKQARILRIVKQSPGGGWQTP